MNSTEYTITEQRVRHNVEAHDLLPVLLALGLIAVGSALRITYFVTNRSLWFDELLLALNIVNRSWWELFAPLDNHQGAPIGFLFAVKALTVALGNGEMALRLLSLSAALASLPLFYWVALRTATTTSSLVALGVFAVGEYTIYYAAEAKQYAVDVVVVLLIYLAVLRVLAEPERRSRYWMLGAIGAAALWFSHPSLFVMAGIGGVLLADAIVAHNRQRLVSLLALFLLWGASLALVYAVSLRHLAGDDALIRYWQAYFMPLPPWSDLAWFALAFERMTQNPLGLYLPWAVVLALLLLGAASLVGRDWRWAGVLTVPLLLTLVASALQRYPFGQRLMLFAVPSLLLLVAAGADRVGLLFRDWPWLRRIVLFVLAVMLLLGPTMRAVALVQSPPMVEHVRPVLQELKRAWQPGDLLYIYYGAEPAFDYYAPLLMLGDENRVVGGNHREDPAEYLAELDALRGHARVWLLFSHIYDWSNIDERAHLLQHLDTFGRPLAEYRAPGASLYLYDLAGQGSSGLSPDGVVVWNVAP